MANYGRAVLPIQRTHRQPDPSETEHALCAECLEFVEQAYDQLTGRGALEPADHCARCRAILEAILAVVPQDMRARGSTHVYKDSKHTKLSVLGKFSVELFQIEGTRIPPERVANLDSK